MSERGVLLSRDLAMRTKQLVEGATASGVPTAGKSVVSGFAGFLSPVELTEAWNNDSGTGWKAKMKRLWFEASTGEYQFNEQNIAEEDIFYPLSVNSKPPGELGSRAFAVYRGRWEIIAFGEFGESDAKELFPAVVYKKLSDTEQPETYIICPGGRGTERSIKTVHVLHVEAKKVSTSMFGSLPTAMSNFGAALADNGYGNPLLVCAPGEVDEGTRYPVQRYEFSQETWSKSDTNQSLAGCPAYLADGKVLVAGGQSAYYVSGPVKLAVSGTTQFYGHNTTPFWNIDPIAGTLDTRVPRRQIISGTAETAESATVNQQKKFLKQNFSGVLYQHTDNGKPVEFIAVGGTELLGYQSKAVVSYAMDSLGALLTCEHNTVGVYDGCEVFPDTPVPFGECGAVRITRRRSGNMTVDCNLLVCIGGRYRTETDIEAKTENGETAKDENGQPIYLYKTGDFIPHESPWYLDLDHKADRWKNDLWDKIPVPRWNAALSEVVTTIEPVLDDDGKATGETQTVDRVFLIGGRFENRFLEKVEIKDKDGKITTTYHKIVTKKGLTASIEALNLTTGKWETDFPGLDRKTS